MMPSEASVRSLQPSYLTERDYPWLRALLEERERFVGKKRSEWSVRVGDAPPVEAPRRKLDIALQVLDRLARDALPTAFAPKQLRAVLFREAAAHRDRATVVANAARRLGISQLMLQEGLFADLASERRLTSVGPISPEQLALRCNVELIARWLARALRVRVRAAGRVRAVVRHAKLMGLLCHIAIGSTEDEVTLDISGPFALFRHSRLYARALTSLVPRLAWCHSFRMEADCVLGAGDRVDRLIVRQGDPIFPARELPPFDSQLEERFAKTFAKLAPSWDIMREPVALQVEGALAFPDFELRHRATGERWLLEIVGYWTPEYLRKKLAALRAAQCERLIVCIDEERRCSDDAFDLAAHVVCFRRRLDPRAVLAIIDPVAHAALPPVVTGGRARRGARAARADSDAAES